VACSIALLAGSNRPPMPSVLFIRKRPRLSHASAPRPCSSWLVMVTGARRLLKKLLTPVRAKRGTTWV